MTGTGTRETSLKERACDMIKPRVVSYWLSQNSESRELRTAYERQAYSPCGYYISLLPAIDGVVYPKLGIKKALTFGIGNRRVRSSYASCQLEKHGIEMLSIKKPPEGGQFQALQNFSKLQPPDLPAPD